MELTNNVSDPALELETCQHEYINLYIRTYIRSIIDHRSILGKTTSFYLDLHGGCFGIDELTDNFCCLQCQ